MYWEKDIEIGEYELLKIIDELEDARRGIVEAQQLSRCD